MNFWRGRFKRSAIAIGGKLLWLFLFRLIMILIYASGIFHHKRTTREKLRTAAGSSAFPGPGNLTSKFEHRPFSFFLFFFKHMQHFTGSQRRKRMFFTESPTRKCFYFANSPMYFCQTNILVNRNSYALEVNASNIPSFS